MERLTERTDDGILVKEDFGDDVLKTLYQCYGAEPMPHYANCDEGYCAMEKLAEYEDLEEQGKLLKLLCAAGDTLPTAYDVDKVLERLEETLLNLTFHKDNNSKTWNKAIHNAIEIVKSGGIE